MKKITLIKIEGCPYCAAAFKAIDEVKKNYPTALLIMIEPPSVEEIKNRLIKRNTESMEKINSRMQRIDYELGKKDLYDYTVVNDDLITAVEEIENIIKSEKSKI